MPPEGELRAAIVQDADSGRVLMLAWMDGEALRLTRETGEAHFYSRSRDRLWRKGETSGNTLAVEELRDDCDGDAYVLRVRANGPACHTGSVSCFAPWLWRTVRERADTRPEGSYVAALLDGGPGAVAQKLGEEGVEAALAVASERRRARGLRARRPVVRELRRPRRARPRPRDGRGRAAQAASVAASPSPVPS